MYIEVEKHRARTQRVKSLGFLLPGPCRWTEYKTVVVQLMILSKGSNGRELEVFAFRVRSGIYLNKSNLLREKKKVGVELG